MRTLPQAKPKRFSVLFLFLVFLVAGCATRNNFVDIGSGSDPNTPDSPSP